MILYWMSQRRNKEKNCFRSKLKWKHYTIKPLGHIENSSTRVINIPTANNKKSEWVKIRDLVIQLKKL